MVTSDEPASRALRELGARVVSDAPSAGLNAALEHGAATIRRHDRQVAVAAMLADLPALRSEDLEAALTAGLVHARWFVTDADGTGTTLLAASAGTPLDPAFGPRSRDAHIRNGAVELLGPDLLRLRRDVDTEEHLSEAAGLGVGRFTQAALADLALAAAPLA